MTKDEYKAYQERFWEFMRAEGIENLSSNSGSKPYFSWYPCECCGSRLGGDREDCTGYNRGLKRVMGPYSVCSDCVYYATYGQLDDVTMMDMEDKE